MAVLHHSFRCPVTPAFERDISNVLTAWDAGDRESLSAMAIAGYGAIAAREDVHFAFSLDPEGAVPSWLQPEFISPGLAALMMLATGFVPVPSLSASSDTNHYRLTSQLPTLGWPVEEIDLLVRGQPIEAMLQGRSFSARRPEAGKFRHTGGWTPGSRTRKLKMRLDALAAGLGPDAEPEALAARAVLAESGALADAQAMLAPIGNDDWLVMSITH